MSAANPRNARGERGFTLVEIFIAISVFAVGVLVLALVIPLGIKRSNRASQQSRASQLVTIRAEALLDAAYTEDDVTAGTHTDTANPYFNQYYMEWIVEDDQPITACKRITVQARRPTSTGAIEAKVVILKAQAEN
jgi:prepilin-type N-terminal cleavage/methylation domain-containing protein